MQIPVARLKTPAGQEIGFNEADVLSAPDKFKGYTFVSGSQRVADLFAPFDDVWADEPATATTKPPAGMEFTQSSPTVVKPIRSTAKKGGK